MKSREKPAAVDCYTGKIMANGLTHCKAAAIDKLNALLPVMNSEEIEYIIEKIYIADISSNYMEVMRLGKEISKTGLESVSPETYHYISEYIAMAAEALKYKNGGANNYDA